MAEIKATLRVQMDKISKSLPEKIFADSSEKGDHDDTDTGPNYEPRWCAIIYRYSCYIWI